MLYYIIYMQGFDDIIVTSGRELPTVDCPYVAPDTCTGVESPQCCSPPPTDSTTDIDVEMSGAIKNNYFPAMLHTLWISIAVLFSWFY